MPITRGQMERQLREGGGIMSLSKEGIGGGDYKGIDMGSRTGFGILKKVKNLGKKAVRGVRDIVSSDLGKAALIAAGGYYLGGGAIGPFQRATPLGEFAFSQIPGASLFTGGKTPFIDSANTELQMLKRAGKLNLDKGILSSNIGKVATLGAVSAFLTKTQGLSPEQAEEELTRDPSTYLELYYRNLNPPGNKDPETYEEEVREFVRQNSADGGRIGFATGESGIMKAKPKFASAILGDESDDIAMQLFGKPVKELTPDEFKDLMDYLDDLEKSFRAEGGRVGFANGPVLPPDPTQPVNPFGPKPGDFGIDEDIPIKMASNIENDKILEALFEKYIDLGFSPKDAADKAMEEFERMSKVKPEQRGLAAMGGKMDTPSDNAMQAAGIEGLPVRKNPAGVTELDLRKTGGFIQPVGIKEKEDDIPAMLSNNEFVFTADAVRGAGGGDVNLGAQRMYDTMKRLEAGGKA